PSPSSALVGGSVRSSEYGRGRRPGPGQDSRTAMVWPTWRERALRPVRPFSLRSLATSSRTGPRSPRAYHRASRCRGCGKRSAQAIAALGDVPSKATGGTVVVCQNSIPSVDDGRATCKPSSAMSLVLALLGALRAALRTRTDLTLENLALRQQLALLRRRSKRPQFGRFDRAFWMWPRVSATGEGHVHRRGSLVITLPLAEPLRRT